MSDTQATSPTTPAEAPITVSTEALPKDLAAHVNTIKAFAQTFNMLQDGHFPSTHFIAAQSCIDFIKQLHAHAVDAASKHEAADLVPELKAYKDEKAAAEKKSAEAVNGQA